MKARVWIPASAVGLIAAGSVLMWLKPTSLPVVTDALGMTDTITITDVHPPKPHDGDGLADDTIEGKTTRFDPDLVDRRESKGWRINASEAVIALDVPLIRPDTEGELLVLRPSYAAAITAADSDRNNGNEILPSVNMIDGKVKQFDDGLYAALDQVYFRGIDGVLPGHVAFLKRIFAKVGPDGAAAPYLAAGLELAGEKAEVKDASQRERRLKAFLGNEAASKPIGFSTWNKTLSEGFRFLRFFQQPLGENDRAVASMLAEVIGGDESLKADYQRTLAFHARLTNPTRWASLADGKGAIPTDRPLALFPPSTSRESELFAKLFPLHVPPDADLMRELVRRIRSGEVDLAPKPDGGWYDHQVYALETLLLPEKGPEGAKLLLSKAYKTRMLEAFKALVTKRRETHVELVTTPPGSAKISPPPELVAPRLRVEPCPSYYLRTARSYAFLALLLDTTPGRPVLESIHGLKEDGERGPDLRAELASMRDLTLGLALLSAEDIGMKLPLLDEEQAIRDRCEAAATRWLAHAKVDPDLACDPRVAIPIDHDPMRGVTRLWATVGVRLTRLDASYARGPRVKPVEGDGDWKTVEPSRLAAAHYLIPVDEFAEVQYKGNRVLSRPELRAVCDAKKTKEAIVSALRAAGDSQPTGTGAQR